MTTTETTSTSWFSRIGNSLKNILVGIVLVIGAVVLLFWNEGRAVKTEQSLKEGLSVVVSVPTDKIDPANEGKLIHFSGEAKITSNLADGEFGVSGSALKMKRVVEVYQWKEEAKSKTVEKLGGGTETTTTYSYVKEWSDHLVDSSNFKEVELHQNPSSKVFADKEWLAQDVTVGSFSINEAMLGALSGYQPLAVTQSMLDAQVTTAGAQLQLVGSTIYYQTKDPSSPEVGNVRISYETITPQVISVVYKQSGKELVPYTTKNDSTLSMIQIGSATAQEMFKNAEESNKMMTWIFRFVGMLLLFIGFQLILGVFHVLGSVVPFIGDVLGAGAGIISFFLTLIVGSVVIAIAWIAYRPIIGIALLVLAGGAYYLMMQRRTK